MSAALRHQQHPPTGHPVPQRPPIPKHVPTCSDHAHVAPQRCTNPRSCSKDQHIGAPPQKRCCKSQAGSTQTPPPSPWCSRWLSPNKETSHKPAPFGQKLLQFIISSPNRSTAGSTAATHQEQGRGVEITEGSPTTPRHCTRAGGCDCIPASPWGAAMGWDPHRGPPLTGGNNIPCPAPATPLLGGFLGGAGEKNKSVGNK